MERAKRLFVEKREAFRVEAQSLLRDFNGNLSLNLRSLRLVNVYDLFGFSDALLEQCRYSVFGEKATDLVSDTNPADSKYLAVEYLPGQFDQRASSALDCVHLIDPDAQVSIKSARLLLFDEDVPEPVIQRIAAYFINPVECRRKDMGVLSLSEKADVKPLEDLSGFTEMEEGAYAAFCRSHGLAMNSDDLREVVRYFRSEGRDPSETELRILDTYWSDHCRHTTFTSTLEEVTVDESFIKADIESSLRLAARMRKDLGREAKALCLMELATLGARYLKARGLLEDLEQSEENNACSIFVTVDVDGKDEQ